MPKLFGRTAAWGISIWTTLAFAAGTALTFSIVYLLVARSARERRDAWLRGEAEVLAQVSANTPRDRLYKTIVQEMAELAARELPDERNAKGQQLNSVFFLEDAPGRSADPLWAGPGSSSNFLAAIHASKLAPGIPQSLRVTGWPHRVRVVAQQTDGGTIYLGLSSRGDARMLDHLTQRFLLLWGGTVLMGFCISYMSAHRTLLRVERITDTVGRIGSQDLTERLPEPVNSDEISRLARTFNRMLDRIQSSVTELRSVTDAVAHDLKSPVTAIRGTLESALSAERTEKWRDSICEAIDGLDRLLRLLNTTLDVAEAQAGALSLHRSTVDFGAVVRTLADLYQPAMAERNHQLSLAIEERLQVDADEPLLQRVLGNLLENELAHLPPGCQVTVRLRSRGGMAELVIEDDGPGFPEEIMNRAFERFVKGKQSTGHGLGLAFVNAVIRAHGGTVQISEREGGGAAVTLSLPVSALQIA